MTKHSTPLVLERCTRCGRRLTLTSLSAGNTCVIVEPCDEAREAALAVFGDAPRSTDA